MRRHIKNYKSESKSIGEGQVLHCPYDFETAKVVLREMAEHLALSLFEKKLVTSSVTLNINYDIESLEKTDYKGEIVTDYYSREVAKPARGTIFVGQDTNSSKAIINGFMDLYEKITDPSLLIRKINVTAINVKPAEMRQGSLFDEEDNDIKEEKLQKVRLEIMKKYGKNALLKCTNLTEGATAIERNSQIGGHKA